jgi:hypothetical protein
MQELVEQIVQKTGLSPEKAKEVLQTVASFVQQKFPQFAGPINSVLGTDASASQNTDTNDLLGGLGSKFGL